MCVFTIILLFTIVIEIMKKSFMKNNKMYLDLTYLLPYYFDDLKINKILKTLKIRRKYYCGQLTVRVVKRGLEASLKKKKT